MSRTGVVPLVLMLASLLCPRSASAQQRAAAAPAQLVRIDRELGPAQEMALSAGQNRLLVLSEDIIRIAVADPKVADLKVITPTQVLLTARGVGATDLTLWNKRDEPLVVALQVSRNLDALRKQLVELFPGESISVTAAGDLVVLSGEVSDVRVPERVAEVAKLHADKVANLVRVSGTQQVQIQVRFAEVQRTALREMGFNFFHKDVGDSRLGGVTGPRTNPGEFLTVPGAGTNGIPEVLSPQFRADAFSLFFSGIRSFPFSLMVSLLETHGMARVLAEPTLVAMSGQEAKFLVGGELPIPLSTGLGTVSVQWKKFGILLAFTPTVIGDGTLHLKLAAEVSDTDPTKAVSVGGFTIPGLTSRQSETTVRLGDGQSFVIAGLLSDRVRSQLSRVPLLGDLPILGALFRSVEYQRDESELMVVVTARLAQPLAPGEVPPLPPEREPNDPGDLELFLLGANGTRDTKGETRPEERGPAGAIGFLRPF